MYRCRPAAVRVRFPVARLLPALHTLPEYQALEDIYEVAARYGVNPIDVIKVDGNESPYGPSPRTIEVLRAVEYHPEWYGDEDQTVLRRALPVPNMERLARSAPRS